MSNSYHLSAGSAALVTLGMAVGAVAPLLISTSAVTQGTAPDAAASFPDIQNHWARPFISALAERNIVAGYPDGTFRPNQAVERDEFAAVIRQAFDQERVRTIESGSVYKDVPSGYWAAPAIEEAYQTGFMHGYPGGFFRPRQEVSRVEALVALTNGLNLAASRPTAAVEKTTTPQATTPPATTPPATQTTTRRATKRSLFLPLAFTHLMQPLLSPAARAQAVPPGARTPAVPNGQAVSPNGAPAPEARKPDVSLSRPASVVLINYYTDAENVPQYAVDSLAVATKANIVVNYPNTQVLNPNQPASRGDVAAFIHQALVAQGKIEPLPGSVEASNYIVGRTQTSSQATPATP